MSVARPDAGLTFPQPGIRDSMAPNSTAQEPRMKPDTRPADETDATVHSSSFHWRTGIQSFFDIDGITIEFWASGWTGKEEVRIDGVVVSSLRSFRYRTVHRFAHGDHAYRVEMKCLSLATGTFRIILFRDDVEVDSDIGSYQNKDVLGPDGKVDWRKAWKKMLPVFLLSGLLGGIFGYTVASWLL
jgi:hypothetical protein